MKDASSVNVIDSIVLINETDATNVYLEWSALDPNITVYKELKSGNATKLFINWSDQNWPIDLQQGDYFTFVIPDIFDYVLVHDATDVEIKNEFGEVVATYSIYDNDVTRMKEVKLTFTDYVETHTDISGNFWILLFVGDVDSTEHINLEFIINGDVVAEGDVTINPSPTNTPKEVKVGYSYPGWNAGGYYIFWWSVYFNMEKNDANGFNTLKDFSFEDILPADSPHIFLTDEIRQELGIPSNQYVSDIREYIGADSYPPENRYDVFTYHYNSAGVGYWLDASKLNQNPIVNGITTVGIDGNNGLNVSDVKITDKLFSANLGTITRPTVINIFTISTVKLAESALGDSEVVELYKNTFKGSAGEDLPATLAVYRFEAGGTAQGISGPYNFMFTKVKEGGAVLPGALFSLFQIDNFPDKADRIAYSDQDGVVTFKKLPAGTYYIQETTAPYGYILDDTIYKVLLTSEGYEIYYGDNFENLLSDNKIVNRPEFIVEPVSVPLEGTKKLTGRTMSDGMFSFVVKDNDGAAAATGTNNADGSIKFSEIEFDSPGVYIFTVEEVVGGYSGITYDTSKFTVTVTVTDDGTGKLSADVSCPGEGIVFNNSYATSSVSVPLEGTKKLTGRTLSGGMFSFVVKDSNGAEAATGTNDADGSINFSEIEFDSPGVYIFTVEEVAGVFSGITYDTSKFTVTVTVTDDGTGKLSADVSYSGEGVVFINSYAVTPVRPCSCYATKCRKSIKGQKIWLDNDNAGGKRPLSVEIILIRDGEVYKRTNVDSAGDGTFIFCCVPIWKNSSHKYNYQIDEAIVPGYTKTIEGYNVINTLIT